MNTSNAPSIKKFRLILIFVLLIYTSFASSSDTTPPASSPASITLSMIDGNDPIDTLIDISLIVMISLTAGLGLVKLYLFWKEKRDIAREDAREEELWR